jgi:hypothetical protein
MFKIKLFLFVQINTHCNVLDLFKIVYAYEMNEKFVRLN